MRKVPITELGTDFAEVLGQIANSPRVVMSSQDFTEVCALMAEMRAALRFYAKLYPCEVCEYGQDGGAMAREVLAKLEAIGKEKKP